MDDSDKINSLETEVNDPTLNLKQIRSIAKTIINNQNARITALETFRTNAITKSTELEARILFLENAP